MRSLRARVFLLSWPLVVVAVAAVALGLERWTIAEFERTEERRVAPGRAPEAAALVPRILDAWPALVAGDTAALREIAATLTPAPVLVLLDTAGRVRAATDARVRVEPVDTAAIDAPFRVERVTRLANGDVRAEFIARPLPLRREGRLLGGLLFVPGDDAGPSAAEVAGARRRALRRRVWLATVVASLAAAAAALLIGGPLVGRLRRVRETADAIGRGEYAARVRDAGADEVGELGRSIDRMADAIARAEAHKRNLVTDVAHELRTPLTNVVGLIEAVQDGLRTPDAATMQALRQEAGLLTALVAELQDLSLLESGQLAVELDDVDVRAAGRAAVAAMAGAGHDLALAGPEDGPPLRARADARRLAQVLRNLLQNAITHTPPGGRVTLAVREAGAAVAIEVADTGRGIPPEHLALVFERFHRVDPSRDRASGGMGLGLALVRQLALAMHGTVRVESVVGAGSRFTVELPRAAD